MKMSQVVDTKKCRVSRAVLAFLVLCFFATGADADLIDVGVPVKGFGDPTEVGVEGWNPFYIPVSAAASGTFGVDAGTSPDYGDGAGGSLMMFMLFDDFHFPPATASLIFKFKDLDLKDDNTPYDLFETVEFLTDAGGAFSPVITDDDDVTSGTFLDFTIEGSNYFRTSLFPMSRASSTRARSR